MNLSELLKKLRNGVISEQGVIPVAEIEEIMNKAADGLEGLIPAIDRLQDHLETGCYISNNLGDQWWIFDKDGEGVCSGDSIRGLLVNLILK